MKSADFAMMYDLPVVSELNRVPNFDPLKYLQKTADGVELPLKYKKLWFRLKYPQGRVRITNLRITDQLAMIEARVFLDRRDVEAVSSHTITCDAKSTPDGMYVKQAQDLATDQALSDAGFGIQFVSVDSEAVSGAKPNAVSVPTALAEKKSTVVASILSSQPAETKAAQEAVTEAVSKAAVPPAIATPVMEERSVERVVPIAMEVETPKNVTPAPVVSGFEKKQYEAENVPSQKADLSYTKDMSVEEISAVMTLDEALNYVVTSGACAGQKLSQVAERRAASLRFYLTGYKGDDNILRAAATLIIASRPELQAS